MKEAKNTSNLSKITKNIFIGNTLLLIGGLLYFKTSYSLGMVLLANVFIMQIDLTLSIISKAEHNTSGWIIFGNILSIMAYFGIYYFVFVFLAGLS